MICQFLRELPHDFVIIFLHQIDKECVARSMHIISNMYTQLMLKASKQCKHVTEFYTILQGGGVAYAFSFSKQTTLSATRFVIFLIYTHQPLHLSELF